MAGVFESLIGVTAVRRDLGERGVLRLTGGDRVRFLNGMLTNDVAKLAAGELCSALLLDRKGRIQSELQVLACDDAFLLDTAPGTASSVYESLERHIIADDVALENLSAAWGHIGLEGPAVRAVLERERMPLPAPGHFERAEWNAESLVWVGEGSLTPEGVQVLGSREQLEKLVLALDLSLLSAEQVELLRIESFLPAYGIDVTERNFPAEARLEHAVSYTKGCFIGQEIVARIRSRGAVKRFLVQIRTEAPVSRGDAIRVGASAVGEITSAAASGASGPVALGYVRAAHAEPGTALDVAVTSGIIAGPALES